MEPRNRFQALNSASLCSLAGRYDNPIPPQFLFPIDSLIIPAQATYTGGIDSLESIPGLLKSLKIFIVSGVWSHTLLVRLLPFMIYNISYLGLLSLILLSSAESRILLLEFKSKGDICGSYQIRSIRMLSSMIRNLFLKPPDIHMHSDYLLYDGRIPLTSCDWWSTAHHSTFKVHFLP